MDADDFLPMSGLQHLLFCPRQCGLMFIEGLWGDNALTVEGKLQHEAADSGRTEDRDGVRIVRSLWLRSEELRLVGRADVVEFRAGPAGPEMAFPVEYKHGVRGDWRHDQVQLCAQAWALEEMLGRPVPAGAIFYQKSRRRREVGFDQALRDLTRQTARRFHQLVESGRTPRAIREKKCGQCSLVELCLPDLGARPPDSASRYVDGLWGPQ